ncbi:MAG: hypothetical protein GF328_11935, partial [Candidatus Latescibacteria bacterium]|nr:hypothetical protein [Candidatus Latescibacterota bacterium]
MSIETSRWLRFASSCAMFALSRMCPGPPHASSMGLVSGLLLLFAPVAGWAAEGELDRGFGDGGVVWPDRHSSWESRMSVAVDSQHRAVLAGTSENTYYVVRYLETGEPDPSFGVAGIVETGIIGSYRASAGVVIQDGGAVVLGGNDGSVGEHFVARYLPTGEPDDAFGVGGVAHTGFHSVVFSHIAVASQTDGKIVLAGNHDASGEHFVARFDTDGSLDMTFGVDGVVWTGFYCNYSSPLDVAIQSDGRILLASPHPNEGEFFVMRFDTTGAPDPGFGNNGLLLTGISASEGSKVALAVQEEDRILLAGTYLREDLVARLLPNGDLDASFGDGGTTSSGIPSVAGANLELAVSDDQRVLLA